MAGEEPSEASKVRLSGRTTVTVREVLGIKGNIEDWMPCVRCGCGALAHGYDEPKQRCLCGRCAGYSLRSGGAPGNSDTPERL